MVSWQPGVTLAQMEKQVIYEALKFFQGNKVQTARALDITPRTLYNKLEIYEGKTNGENTEGQPASIDSAGLQDNNLQATDRLRDESPKEISSEQPMPMRERTKVQEMPSRNTPGLHHGSGSKRARSR